MNNKNINYDILIENSLKNVVKGALLFAEKNGITDNYFYITFKTDAKNVDIPAILKEQYPNTMTIVLQHQFNNLRVEDDFFQVDLSFRAVPYRLKITFDSVTEFADPYANLGLNFTRNETDTDTEQKQKSTAEVVSIDKFRKK